MLVFRVGNYFQRLHSETKCSKKNGAKTQLSKLPSLSLSGCRPWRARTRPKAAWPFATHHPPHRSPQRCGHSHAMSPCRVLKKYAFWGHGKSKILNMPCSKKQASKQTIKQAKHQNSHKFSLIKNPTNQTFLCRVAWPILPLWAMKPFGSTFLTKILPDSYQGIVGCTPTNVPLQEIPK